MNKNNLFRFLLGLAKFLFTYFLISMFFRACAALRS